MNTRIKARKIDGARRLYRDEAKQRYYARQRSIRYARYINSLGASQ